MSAAVDAVAAVVASVNAIAVKAAALALSVAAIALAVIAKFIDTDAVLIAVAALDADVDAVAVVVTASDIAVVSSLNESESVDIVDGSILVLIFTADVAALAVAVTNADISVVAVTLAVFVDVIDADDAFASVNIFNISPSTVLADVNDINTKLFDDCIVAAAAVAASEIVFAVFASYGIVIPSIVGGFVNRNKINSPIIHIVIPIIILYFLFIFSYI